MQGVACRYPEGGMKGDGVAFSLDSRVPFELQAVCAPFWGEARFWRHSRGLVTMPYGGTAFTMGTQPALNERPAPATLCQQSGQAGGPLGLRRAGPGWDLSRHRAGGCQTLRTTWPFESYLRVRAKGPHCG